MTKNERASDRRMIGKCGFPAGQNALDELLSDDAVIVIRGLLRVLMPVRISMIRVPGIDDVIGQWLEVDGQCTKREPEK